MHDCISQDLFLIKLTIGATQICIISLGRGMVGSLNIAKNKYETTFTSMLFLISGVSFNRCKFAP